MWPATRVLTKRIGAGDDGLGHRRRHDQRRIGLACRCAGRDCAGEPGRYGRGSRRQRELVRRGISITGITLQGPGKSAGSPTNISAGLVTMTKHASELTRLIGFRFTGTDQHLAIGGSVSARAFVVDNCHFHNAGSEWCNMTTNGGLFCRNTITAPTPHSSRRLPHQPRRPRRRGPRLLAGCAQHGIGRQHRRDKYLLRGQPLDEPARGLRRRR